MAAGSADRGRQIEQLLMQGRVEQAAQAALRWAAQSPSDADALHCASVTQHKLGHNERALHYALGAARLEPGSPVRHVALARIQYQLMRPDEAVRTLERALGLDPANITALADLAMLLAGLRQYARALQVSDRALALDPGAAGVLMNKVSLLVSVGRVDEAYALAGRIAAATPGEPYIRSLRCLIGNYTSAPAAELLRNHRDFGECLPRARRTTPTRPPTDTTPGRRLRLGIVSSDLRSHSVAYFLEPLLEHLDRSRFEVVVFHTNKVEDETSARLKGLVSGWRTQNGAAPDDIARWLIEQRTDIMLDLSGHTQPQGMIAASLRAAPVQVTWLGYPNTTGVREMDWRIVDSTTDPAGEAEARATERLLRLDPCFVCYRPPEDAPPVAPLPGAGGPPTFVSFNSLQKLNPMVAALWGGVLARVPGSRLVLKMTNLSEPELQRDVQERLASWGLTPDRTEVLLSAGSRVEHLATYARAHVALDTFPYHGTTTTCEALWMGVPVVTLMGDRHAARVGGSVLTAAGVPELVARDDTEFIDRTASLAQDRARLERYRSTLRDRVRASVLCDARAFAERFGNAMERVWRERAGL